MTTVDRRISLREKGLFSRRRFLKACSGALAAFVPAPFRPLSAGPLNDQGASFRERSAGIFRLSPHYLSESPLEFTLEKVDPARDAFPLEADAWSIHQVLERWSEALLQGDSGLSRIWQSFNPAFRGGSLEAREEVLPRSDGNLEIRRRRYAGETPLGADDFLNRLRAEWNAGRFLSAAFKIAGISRAGEDAFRTHVRYDLVDAASGYYRQHRTGFCDLEWKKNPSGAWTVVRWKALEETSSRAAQPVFQEITAEVLGSNHSYREQLRRGTDYWRTVLDGACGIDIYGNYGVAFGDINNDGFDDLYVCQPSGLPNRLYRNRGDGAFEDVTEAAGVGVLDSSPCALFADLNNDGRQDLLVVSGTAPLLFLNRGDGKFRLKENAFHFAHSPQGTFTAAALADYDRDGWLDVYFCLYSYYEGPDRYRYPAPYYNAQNGPANFLFRNNGDGTFRDVTGRAGLDQNNNRFSFACGWADYNNDGWPDLYVANDFGQKNLYRNNGDGTFTDVASEAGVLDTGAGMSVCWLDYDNDGQQDLYVADMWSAAGIRLTAQDGFMPQAPESVRALYRKHAMGNSLFRDQGGGLFHDATSTSGAGYGGWAWSSDSWDFDQDGFADLYIANGMISGPKPRDLSSFFWRQVVAHSPSDSTPTERYEQGWNAINELIRSDGTWSGYQRNVFYANNRNGTFSDVSGAVGLDFVDDSRSFALADFDHDGRLEVVLKNRTGPQVRVLRNVMPSIGESVSFRLRGTKSNRDAIGASITVKSDSGRQTKFLQAGSGFLAQHTKEVFFGLGRSRQPIEVTVRWPSGAVEHFESVPIGQRIEIDEGSRQFRALPFQNPLRPAVGARRAVPLRSRVAESLPSQFETWLLAPLDPPRFSLPDLSERMRSLSDYRGQRVLLGFWAVPAPLCATELRKFQSHFARWSTAGIHLLTVNVDPPEAAAEVRQIARRLGLTFPVLLGTGDVASLYNLLYRYLFDRRQNLALPTTFLIDEAGTIVKVYQGPLNTGSIMRDAGKIPHTAQERQAKALPFTGTFYGGEFLRNYFTYGVTFARHGYLEAAEGAFLQAIRQEPELSDAYYDLGTLYMKQRRWDVAREQLSKAIQLKPDDLMSLNNLGVIAARLGRKVEAAAYFNQALHVDPENTLALGNLADLDRSEGRLREAQALLQRALKIAPEDPELNYRLGMTFADAHQNEQAKYYLQRAVQLRPDYPEALNNLGVLYLMMDEPSLAMAQFQASIARAPKFDAAYLNLARLDIQLGHRADARAVLRHLLAEIPNHPLAKKYLEELNQ